MLRRSIVGIISLIVFLSVPAGATNDAVSRGGAKGQLVHATGTATTHTSNGVVVQQLDLWFLDASNYKVVATATGPIDIVDIMIEEEGKRQDVYRRGDRIDAVLRRDHTRSFAVVGAAEHLPNARVYERSNGLATDYELSFGEVTVRVTYRSVDRVASSGQLDVDLPRGTRWRSDAEDGAMAGIVAEDNVGLIQSTGGHSRLQWAGGGICMRIYNYRNNVSGFFTAYSHIYKSGLTCYKVDMALWSAPVEGSGACSAVGWLGSGPTSTVYSSYSAYGFPQAGNRMCSTHWGWNSSNVLITGFVGYNAAITG